MPKFIQAKVREFTQRTEFTARQIEELYERYKQIDRSRHAVDGVSLEAMMNIPEFVAHPFIADILRVSASAKSETKVQEGKRQEPIATTVKKGENEEVDEKDLRFTFDDYIMLAWKLSAKASDKVKQELAWRVIDIWQAGILRYAEMFRVYRMLMARSLTDDQCMDFATRALNLSHLKKRGEMQKEEFFDVVPPYEIRLKFTIDLQIKSSQ